MCLSFIVPESRAQSKFITCVLNLFFFRSKYVIYVPNLVVYKRPLKVYHMCASLFFSFFITLSLTYMLRLAAPVSKNKLCSIKNLQCICCLYFKERYKCGKEEYQDCHCVFGNKKTKIRKDVRDYEFGTYGILIGFLFSIGTYVFWNCFDKPEFKRNGVKPALRKFSTLDPPNLSLNTY